MIFRKYGVAWIVTDIKGKPYVFCFASITLKGFDGKDWFWEEDFWKDALAEQAYG